MAKKDQPKTPLLSITLLLVALGVILFFSCIGLIVVGLVVVGIQKTRDVAARHHSYENLRNCALATHNAHDLNKSFPPFFGYYGQMDPIGNPRSQQASFFVHLLPFVEQSPLYITCLTDPNKVNQPGVVVPAYLLTADYTRTNNGEGTTNLAVNLRLWQTSGQTNLQAPTVSLNMKGGVSQPIKVRMPFTFQDGTSNTLLFATRLQVCGGANTVINVPPIFTGTSKGPYFGWTNATPANQSLDSVGLGWQPAPNASACIANANLAHSYSPEAIHVALCDGSARSISSTTTFGTWTMVLTPNGGENLPLNWGD